MESSTKLYTKTKSSCSHGFTSVLDYGKSIHFILKKSPRKVYSSFRNTQTRARAEINA